MDSAAWSHWELLRFVIFQLKTCWWWEDQRWQADEDMQITKATGWGILRLEWRKLDHGIQIYDQNWCLRRNTHTTLDIWVEFAEVSSHFQLTYPLINLYFWTAEAQGAGWPCSPPGVQNGPGQISSQRPFRSGCEWHVGMDMRPSVGLLYFIWIIPENSVTSITTLRNNPDRLAPNTT